MEIVPILVLFVPDIFVYVQIAFVNIGRAREIVARIDEGDVLVGKA